MTIRLSGDRVVLRAFREAEFAGMWDRELARGGSGDRDRYFAFLGATGGWNGDELRLAIETDGALVGDIQARRSRTAMPEGVTELGIALFDGWTGRGLGTEALRLFCHGQRPSISRVSVQLRNVRTSTRRPSTATLVSVGSTAIVLTMSAATRTSRPSRTVMPTRVRSV